MEEFKYVARSDDRVSIEPKKIRHYVPTPKDSRKSEKRLLSVYNMKYSRSVFIGLQAEQAPSEP